MRTEKVVSGDASYTYLYDGEKVVEIYKDGLNNSCRYVLMYDNDGKPHAIYLYEEASTTPQKYFYVLNVQGDVVQLRDINNALVAKYAYDAWGKLLSVTDASGAEITNTLHIAHANPIRYRGYFYDVETALYYCNSRYYDPQVRRFINADTEDVLHATPGEFTDKNLFAYCDNNPVMRKDLGGEFWDTVFDVVSLAISIVDVVKNPSDPMAWVGLAADTLSLVVPGVTGGGALVKTLSKADNIVDATKTSSKVAKKASKVTKTTSKVITKKTVSRSFRELRQDIIDHPKRWKMINEKISESTKKGNKGGLSIERVYKSKKTGEYIYEHILKNKNGRIIDKHFRPYGK